jgi:hypothetical protein
MLMLGATGIVGLFFAATTNNGLATQLTPDNGMRDKGVDQTIQDTCSSDNTFFVRAKKSIQDTGIASGTR